MTRLEIAARMLPGINEAHLRDIGSDVKTALEVPGSVKRYVPVNGVRPAAASVNRMPTPVPRRRTVSVPSKVASMRAAPSTHERTDGLASTRVPTRTPSRSGMSPSTACMPF